jgi:hypothetical protein
MLPSVGTVRKFFARTRLPAFGLPPGYHSNSWVGRAIQLDEHWQI